MTWDLLFFLLIPVVSGLVGWGTNVLAIKMMFAPLEFIGIPPRLGWQGIIPAKAGKMGADCVEMMTSSKVLSMQELFGRLDPVLIASSLRPVLLKLSEKIVEEVIAENYPRLWEHMPGRAKEAIFARIQREIPTVVERLMEDLQADIESYCNIKKLAVELFLEDKKLLNEIFLRCGSAEFRFIGRSGLGFGLLFGLIQMVLFWFFSQQGWILPVTGLAVGYATNWLALAMIFTPLEPRNYFGFTWQGLFLRRQKEVSKEYAALFASKVFRPANLIDAIVNGAASDQLMASVQRHVRNAVDEATGEGKKIIEFMMGSQRYETMKETITGRILQEAPDLLLAPKFQSQRY